MFRYFNNKEGEHKMSATTGFPQNFLWGAATASFQVEGYPREEGGGESVWERFCTMPGRIASDHNGNVGPAQFKKFKDDVQLMKWLGIKAYRMSIAWSRVFPDGETLNPRGLDYYNRLIDELLANGIDPWVTMFHWDHPQALEDKFGGWRSKDTVKAFGNYVAYVTDKISDRVTNFFTVNEIMCFTSSSYGSGCHAPGLQLDNKTVNQSVHNGCLAHGTALQAIRTHARRPVKVGIVENMAVTVPAFASEENVRAARTAFRIYSGSRLTAMLEGKYPDFQLEEWGKDAPEYDDAEMKLIGQPMDFVGCNVYAPVYVMADPNAKHGYREIPLPAGYPKMDMPWLHVGPDITYWAPRFLKEIWNVDAVYITENGCAAQDKPASDGEIYDTDRTMYLRHHFLAAQRATAEGWPLKGYFVWSLMDNFEWSWGYTKRFGIVYVNYETLERIPKLSAKFYRETIRQNAVV